jgi:hypothetical protein
MRGVSLLLGLWLALSVGSVEAYGQQFDHSAWDHVLREFVNEQGRVDYAALKANPAELNRYMTELASRSPVSDPQNFPTRESQLAYWINAYNALVLKGVIDHWPIESVRKIGGLPYSFFWRKKFVLGERKYTLDAIEGIMRENLAEPRIHFALVCAANSCPRLQRQAYTPENTDRLLEEAARFYVNEPRNLRIDAEQNRVTVARIFTFYHDDFENYVREKNLTGIGQPILDRLHQGVRQRGASAGPGRAQSPRFAALRLRLENQ